MGMIEPPTETPDRNGEPWIFCGLCGSRMAWTYIGTAFSRVTGKPGRKFVWSCPDWSRSESRHDRLDRATLVE